MFLPAQPSAATTPGVEVGRRPGRRIPTLVASGALVTAVLIGAAACGSGSGGSSSSSGGSAASIDSAGSAAGGNGQAAKPAVAPQFAASGSTTLDKSASGTAAADLLQQRRLILDTGLSVTVGNVAQAAGQVRTLTAGAGGYVGDEETGGTGKTARSTLTLRIPSAKVGAVTDQVAALGMVRSRSQNSQDVTQQSVDVASRLATQKASIARVRALLSRATKISDIILIEGELSNRESNLESLEAQLTSLNDSVDLATLTVTLTPAGVPTKPVKADTGFLAGLGHGWSAFVAALVVALTVLGAVLPFAALVTLVGVPALVLYRRRRTAPVALPVAATPASEA